MVFIQKNTIENLIVVLASILLFVGLVNAPFISQYLKDFPLIIVVMGLLLVVFADTIAQKIQMVDKQSATAILRLLGGIFLFNGLVNIEAILSLIVQYSLPTIGIALALLIFKDKIAGGIGG